MPAFPTITHVALTVSDLSQSVPWYAELFSAKPVLDEDTGRGYQRKFNATHSLDFWRYIQQEKSSTIPLTLNARERADGAWRLERDRAPHARHTTTRTP